MGASQQRAYFPPLTAEVGAPGLSGVGPAGQLLLLGQDRVRKTVVLGGGLLPLRPSTDVIRHCESTLLPE